MSGARARGAARRARHARRRSSRRRRRCARCCASGSACEVTEQQAARGDRGRDRLLPRPPGRGPRRGRASRSCARAARRCCATRCPDPARLAGVDAPGDDRAAARLARASARSTTCRRRSGRGCAARAAARRREQLGRSLPETLDRRRPARAGRRGRQLGRVRRAPSPTRRLRASALRLAGAAPTRRCTSATASTRTSARRPGRRDRAVLLVARRAAPVPASSDRLAAHARPIARAARDRELTALADAARRRSLTPSRAGRGRQSCRRPAERPLRRCGSRPAALLLGLCGGIFATLLVDVDRLGVRLAARATRRPRSTSSPTSCSTSRSSARRCTSRVLQRLDGPRRVRLPAGSRWRLGVGGGRARRRSSTTCVTLAVRRRCFTCTGPTSCRARSGCTSSTAALRRHRGVRVRGRADRRGVLLPRLPVRRAARMQVRVGRRRARAVGRGGDRRAAVRARAPRLGSPKYLIPLGVSRLRPLPRALAHRLAVPMHGAALAQQLPRARRQPARAGTRARSSAADGRLARRDRAGDRAAGASARRRRQ